jgi:hypothetical protein
MKGKGKAKESEEVFWRLWGEREDRIKKVEGTWDIEDTGRKGEVEEVVEGRWEAEGNGM